MSFWGDKVLFIFNILHFFERLKSGKCSAGEGVEDNGSLFDLTVPLCHRGLQFLRFTITHPTFVNRRRFNANEPVFAHDLICYLRGWGGVVLVLKGPYHNAFFVKFSNNYRYFSIVKIAIKQEFSAHFFHTNLPPDKNLEKKFDLMESMEK